MYYFSCMCSYDAFEEVLLDTFLSVWLQTEPCVHFWVGSEQEWCDERLRRKRRYWETPTKVWHWWYTWVCRFGSTSSASFGGNSGGTQKMEHLKLDFIRQVESKNLFLPASMENETEFSVLSRYLSCLVIFGNHWKLGTKKWIWVLCGERRLEGI